MSKWYEIEQVYLDDIIKKQKMTKSIIGESIGDIVHEDIQEVYFILDEKNSAVKIGVSHFAEKRLRMIQAHNPNKLRIIAVIPPWDIEGENMEGALHERFKEYHIHGEWFRHEGKLRDFIQELPSFVNRD